jgi:AAT family amino acid transporter/GABA permease/histidine transporter
MSTDVDQAAAATGSAGTLHRALHLRHLVTLSIGGTLGSGFFLGVGGALSTGGPGVVVTYLIAGIVVIGVMACLAELSVQGQAAGGFAIYAQERLGPWAGFMTGWNYWLAWAAGMGAEGIAVGTYVHSLSAFHSIPIWLIAFVVVAVDFGINLIGVLTMGNYEFWLSTIKIVALIVFALAVLAAVTGIAGDTSGSNLLTSHGGLFPTGVHGLFNSFLIVFFAFTGVEMINISAEESVQPERDVPRALIGTAIGIMVLFIAAVLALAAAIPWNHVGTSSSPFYDGLHALHFPLLANLMVLAIIISSISALDSGLYASSRMLFALSREGYFPKSMSKTHPTRQVPVAALLVCGACIFGGVLLSVITPSYAFIFLGSLATLGFMWAYVLIPVLQILYRRGLTKEEVGRLRWRVPGYPVTPIVCILLVLTAIVAPIFQNNPGAFGINAGLLPVVAGAIWMAVWSAYYFIVGRRFKQLSEQAVEPS